LNAHRKTAIRVVLSIGLMFSAGVAAHGVTEQKVPTTEGGVLRQFQARIDEYMVLHSRLEKESPPLKTADNPAAIRASQKALAEKIRAERPKPVQGAIFTPETRTVFRRRLKTLLQGPTGVELRRAMNDDAPSPIPLRVHAEYPPGWPLASVPPAILASLPKLPEDLEYRFVGKAMLLLDVHANLIIDFIPDAIR